MLHRLGGLVRGVQCDQQGLHDLVGVPEGQVVVGVAGIAVHFLAFALDIDHLAANKAVSAKQVGQDLDSAGVARLAHKFKCQNAQSIASHNSRSLAKLLMAGGLAPTEIVVVDTRQIIVNQGEGVNHLQGDHSIFHTFALAAKHIKGGPDKGRTQALASS